MSLVSENLLAILAKGAEQADTRADWPEASWDALRQAGVLAWAVPREHGGLGLDPVQVLPGFVTLAAACPTTTFIFSQRESALRQLVRGANQSLAARNLSGLAKGEWFLTVGLSQLTTSRQHRAPALTATPEDGGYRLHGEAPWVTAADHADALVLGATLPDSRQALFVVPANSPGLRVDAPLDLAALVGSRTTVVHCDNVLLPSEHLLAGPAERVMGPSGGGGLETSALALGLATAATDQLHAEASKRPGLDHLAGAFAAEASAVRERLLELAGQPAQAPEPVLALRVRATRLALRATQAVLAVAKGVGFVKPHPAQRWARQALFFLVWSCPRPAAEGVLNDLLP